jgi:hypothetical protein
MLPYRDSVVTRIALVAFFVLVLTYGYFEVQGLLFGPRISVSSHALEVHESTVAIRGFAERISELRMNGKAIPVTEDGAFDEVLVVAPGYNRVVLEASDTYGRARKQIVEIVYTPLPSEGAPEAGATSTFPLAPSVP